MNGLQFTASIIDTLAWPAVVLAILLVYRTEVKSLLQRARKIIGPSGAGIDLGEPSSSSAVAREDPAPPQWPRERPADSYWLAHDLMWTIAVTLLGGPIAQVSEGLKQARQHCQALQLSTTTAGKKLEVLHTIIKVRLNTDWTSEERERLSRDIREISDEFAAYASVTQGNHG